MPSDLKDFEALFECRRCGACCRGYGGTYVSEPEIEAISRYIDSDPRRFIAEYCDFSGTKPVLAQKKDGFCVFWDQLCTIHPVKPQMCRRWPFLESILVDPNNWQIMADSCPGIRSDAPDGMVRKCVKETLLNEGC